MRELADLLESHTRFEERRLFPLVEEVASQALSQLDLAAPRAADTEGVIDPSNSWIPMAERRPERGAAPLDRET